MRRFFKFLHTMGAIGLMGAMSVLIILAVLSPEPAVIETYAMYRDGFTVRPVVDGVH